jgi:hypothetical protein
VLVGGTSDPHADQLAGRLGMTWPTPATPIGRTLLVNYPAAVGFGGVSGIPNISVLGTGNYIDSAEIGANRTVNAINWSNTDQQVVIYTLSQGADVVDLALIKYEANPIAGKTVHVVQYGSPSYPNTGWWNTIPAGIPGLPNYGPLDTTGLQQSSLTSVCLRGDSVCGAGNPLATPASAFYLIPGYYMHGVIYTYDNLSPYSAVDDGDPGTLTEVLVPNAAGGATVRAVVVDNGTTVTTYTDGTVVTSWSNGSTTYTVIDNGQNPWGWMLRNLGVPVPTQVDQALNFLVPVPMPGRSGTVGPLTVPTVFQIQKKLLPFTVGPQPQSPQPQPITLSTASLPVNSNLDGAGVHAIDRPGTVPFTKLRAALKSDGADPAATPTPADPKPNPPAAPVVAGDASPRHGWTPGSRPWSHAPSQPSGDTGGDAAAPSGHGGENARPGRIGGLGGGFGGRNH